MWCVHRNPRRVECIHTCAVYKYTCVVVITSTIVSFRTVLKNVAPCRCQLSLPLLFLMPPETDCWPYSKRAGSALRLRNFSTFDRETVIDRCTYTCERTFCFLLKRIQFSYFRCWTIQMINRKGSCIHKSKKSRNIIYIIPTISWRQIQWIRKVLHDK